MNKLIMGLSFLGVLSTVSCDNNEHSEKVGHSLKSVSFSTASSNGINVTQGDKVILKIVDKDGKVIKYYTDADRTTGTTFTDVGKEFTFKADGSLDGGFYLEASSDAYSIVKFNLNDVSGNKKYELKEPVSLTVTTGKAARANVPLVEKKEGTVTGEDIVYISDDNFRAYLKNKIPHAFVGDYMKFDHTDVKSLKTMYCQRLNIKSLQGIEYFTALTDLDCYKNQLTSLNLEKNTALTTLRCYDNKLTSLNLKNHTHLTKLYCNDNKLTSLNLEKDTALTELYCDYNQLTSLNLKDNTHLTKLFCDRNQLTSLNLENHTHLTTLYCNRNQLTSLNLEKDTALIYLYCNRNQLTSLNLETNTNLNLVNCADNQITTLDLSHNCLLTSYCSCVICDFG